jgi:hypothetical protein
MLGLVTKIAAAVPQLQIVTNSVPQNAFCDGQRNISVTFRNSGDGTFDGEIRCKIFQATSATAVLLDDFAWKILQVLPGQTVIESAPIHFPPVKAKTKFLIQWLEESNSPGTTEVLVYPTNLLTELRSLADNKPIGIFDPQNRLKPLLKNLRIDFEDLAELGLTNFTGKLAIVEPFRTKSDIPDDWVNKIKALAQKNVGIVWVQSPDKSDKLKPSFDSVPEKDVAVVIVQPDLVSDLAENPQSQLNLIYFCKWALNPQPSTLLELTPPQ